MAKRRLPDLADDHRCTRNGTKWRCHLPRLPGKSYCQKHHLFNLARSQSQSKSKSSQSQFLTLTPSPNPSANRALLREIWAFHLPSPDARPRLYARVERRIPNQSLVEVTPVLPYPNPTADAACGLFKATDSTEAREMGTFSHRVWFEIGGSEGELYKIFPRKGEIWAVEEYGWVEMMTSFGDVDGASGIVLVAEEGEGVFRRRLYEGCELIRRFSMEEMGMFSHRVSGAKVLGVGEGLLLQVLNPPIQHVNETTQLFISPRMTRQRTECVSVPVPRCGDRATTSTTKVDIGPCHYAGTAPLHQRAQNVDVGHTSTLGPMLTSGCSRHPGMLLASRPHPSLLRLALFPVPPCTFLLATVATLAHLRTGCKLPRSFPPNGHP